MVWGLGLRSRLLAAAGVAVIMGAYSDAPAKAADLGGDCCSDLEERVAEFEATRARKGNKKVSVTLYGQVNKSVLWWDDGAEKNTYVVDNNYESSRFGFKGSAKIGGDWSAGYRMEIETITAQSNLVNQFNPGDDPSFGLLNVRHSYMYLDNKRWGQVRWGLTATPIYNITKDTNVTELEDTMHSDNRMNQAFFLRPKGSNTEAGLSNLRWSDISRCYDSSNASYARRTRTASRIGRPNGTASPPHGASSKTTCGAAPSATRKSGARTGTSALASVTRRRPTSGC